MLKHHICLLTLPRHCVVPETLTTILIKKKCHYVMVMRWCGLYKVQTTIGVKIVETLYLNRVISENKRIRTPPLPPPFKVGVFFVFYR